MATLNMSGPNSLTNPQIDTVVPNKTAGNYALGYTDPNGTFIVKYVGRADTDLNARLKSWVGKYKQFKCSSATSAKAAFQKECTNYHDFGEDQSLDNKIHPDQPAGADWRCPVCDPVEV